MTAGHHAGTVWRAVILRHPMSVHARAERRGDAPGRIEANCVRLAAAQRQRVDVEAVALRDRQRRRRIDAPLSSTTAFVMFYSHSRCGVSEYTVRHP